MASGDDCAADGSIYRDGSRHLQDEFDSRRLADRLEQTLLHRALSDDDRAFVERMDMFFLATVDAQGHPNCSYKGGEPGFVRVLDEHTLAFPSYDGNGMHLSGGSVLDTGDVGLLFIDFDQRKRLRINGTAEVERGAELLRSFPEAQFVVRVHVREVFPNCPRYIHKMKLIERSRFVPGAGQKTPVPSWKKMDLFSDALPDGDPARDESREVADS